jgi:hypothetical protein
MSVVCPGIFSVGGFTNSVENRGQIERGSGDGSPYSGVPLNLQMNETHILIRLLWMYIPQNWEFSSALVKPQNFGGVGGLNPLGTPLWERDGPWRSSVLLPKLGCKEHNQSSPSTVLRSRSKIMSFDCPQQYIMETYPITLSLLMSYICGAPGKTRNFNVVIYMDVLSLKNCYTFKNSKNYLSITAIYIETWSSWTKFQRI